jgi:hypothetical protein
MKKLSGSLHLGLALSILFVILGILLISGSCYTSKQSGFAIYLTKGDAPPDQMPALSHVDIADQPIIGMNDIITYNSQTYELKLTAAAYQRIAQLEVPVRGTSFMVCVDKQPVYAGAFWTPISSIAYNGVTIWKPLTSAKPYIVTLELGYPSTSFYGGEDPRNSPQIIDSFKKAGKLITKMNINSVSQLPVSGKGYELYSWSENGQWHFTLITGTDRDKTLYEIITADDYISEAGWVCIDAAGVDAIKAVLRKLPEGEEVMWEAGLPSGTLPDGIKNTLPPASTIDNIKAYAKQCGLNLTAPSY